MTGISENVLTDEKWLGFVIGQILSNALKYTRTGGIHIYLKNSPAGNYVFKHNSGNSRYTRNRRHRHRHSCGKTCLAYSKRLHRVNGRESNRATGIGLYLCNKIMNRLGHRIYAVSEEGKGTKVFWNFLRKI